MDLPGGVYSRDLKITAMRALDAGARSCWNDGAVSGGRKGTWLCPASAQHFKDHHPQAVVSGADACSKKSVKPQRQAGRDALCAMTRPNRAGFYRSLLPPQGIPGEMELCNEMQKIALESPRYGRPRITAELRRRGWKVKSVARILREDNLLCLQPRKFVVATTDSKRDFPIYPNLASSREPTRIGDLLTHHSDRGVPYASRDYKGLLKHRCLTWNR